MNIADKLLVIAENMQKVFEAGKKQGGGGVEYSSIIHNDDNTVTLTETNGTEHTMACEYDGDKLISITYDGETIELTYDGDVLVAIGGMSVDMSNAPADTRLKELVEGTLTELVDDTITTVGGYSFYNSPLQKIDLSNCITVAKSGFNNATNLTSLNLPNCTTVGDTAFYGCTILERIDLGSVTKIGTKSFYNCKALTTLIIRTNQVAKMTETTYMFGYSAIGSGTGYIYVPDDLVENYKKTAGWSSYADQIKGLSELGG